MRQLMRTATSRMGLARPAHWMLYRGEVAILTYHAVVREPLAIGDSCFLDAGLFARQIAYLKRHFDVIPLADVVARLRQGRITRPTAAITFDDGYQNNYDVAWPILRAAGVPATIFLVTDLIGTARTVWSCLLHRALTETSQSTLAWDGCHYDLRHASGRAHAATDLKRRLKLLRPQELDAALAALLRALGDTAGRAVEPGSPFRMLAGDAIREMARSGLIDFGAHTRTHAILSLLSDEETRREVSGSVNAVTAVSGRRCTQFAYPNGRLQDYTPGSLAALTAAGIETAVTTVRRPNTPQTPPLELGRYNIRGGMTLADFQMRVHHLETHMSGAA